jgi:hypothetical protein
MNEDIMKNLAVTLCIAGTALALTACDTTGQGNVETAAPYATERTASGDNSAAPAREERVFRSSQSK